jgi:hypothetical protein
VITRQGLQGALSLTGWSKVYNIKDVDAVLVYITAGIVSALNVVALTGMRRRNHVAVEDLLDLAGIESANRMVVKAIAAET